MDISKNGLDIIKYFEGFKAKMYLCPAGLPTIGYGTLIDTVSEQYLKGITINESQATDLLKADCAFFEKSIDKYVIKPLNQNQFDALVCFIYNVGPDNFRKSTMLKKININPSDPTIKDEFMKWNRAGGKVLKGLTNRRTMEADLYCKK